MKTPNSKPLWIPEGGKNLQRWCKTLQASITLSGSHGGYTLHQICNPDSFDKGVTHWTGTRVWKQSPVTCVKATTWRQEYLSIDRNYWSSLYREDLILKQVQVIKSDNYLTASRLQQLSYTHIHLSVSRMPKTQLTLAPAKLKSRH